MSKGRKCCMGLYVSTGGWESDTYQKRKCNRCGHIKIFGGRRNELTNCYKTRIN